MRGQSWALTRSGQLRVVVNVVFWKAKGKAATYRDRRYRQLQNTESGVNHVPAGSAQLAAKARQSRGRGTINLVARAIYPDGGGSGEVRARFGRGYGQQPDSNVPSETRPGFTITQRPSPPRPPSWRSRPGLCAAVSAPRAPQGSRRSQRAPRGASARRRRPQAAQRVSPADHAIMRAGTRPRRWHREPRCGRRGSRARADPESGRPPDMERRRVATGANHPASHSSAFRRGPGTPAAVPRRGTRAPI